MERAKFGVWGIWLGGLAAMIYGDGGVEIAGHAIFWGTLAAHVVEFVIQRPLFERAGGSMGHHFVQTLIYGLFHWKPIQQRLEDEGR